MANIPLYLAHGAGAGYKTSDSLASLRATLSSSFKGVIPVTFQYMQEQESTGKRRPPPRFEKLVPEYIEAITQETSVVVAGKSMGGRVATQLSDQDNVKGIICFGFPFHPPGKPEKHRLAFLDTVNVPCLIIQGTRDPFGKPDWVNQQNFNSHIEVRWIEGGDHDFNTLKKQRISEQETQALIQRIVNDWLVKIGLGV